MTGTVIAPCGEAALRIVAVSGTPEERWRTVHALADWIERTRPYGVYGGVPTYDSLLVEFDPMLTAAEPLAELLRDAAALDRTGVRASKRFELPVVYGGEHGPDLPFVAEVTGLTERQVVELHADRDYVVRCLGGPAAACMIDGPPFPVAIPRLSDPRVEVPPNAISVAGAQGVIGPARSPSGWRLIGLSPVQLFDFRTETIVPYRPGDVVRFRAIAASEWDDYAGVHMGDLAQAC